MIQKRKIIHGTLSGLSQEADEGSTQLYVGLRIDSMRAAVGKETSAGTVGYALTFLDKLLRRTNSNRVVDVALKIRGTQVDPDSVGATLQRAEGVYEGGREQTALLSWIFFPSDREEDYATFKQNIEALAEELALAFAQKEVLIRGRRPDGRSFRKTATATGFPPPGQALEKFVNALKQE